ncbi:PPOX class F420-dependent oxidoreductase [Ruania halotolerans]|uniref:PPOX class F420-dependent oxidoreductase n=1 Tax=Ruania halotolerans TaxID=2897773 RepID=UPI001E37264C|nr:PPOX class F420-dependent oxidoreductase [Ruania halotolerans]UFU07775.1 PPOX class F420-dependent oxidoreductase [Ruania halotolerans]
MSYAPMTDDEIQAFIRATPARTVAVATTRKDGRPHVAPVWVDFDDEADAIVFNTGADTVKGRSLARTGQVALTFHDDVPPFNFVSIEGTVELIDDLTQVHTWATRIASRYMGPDRAQEFGDRNGVPGELLVRVTPTKVIAARNLAD